MVDINYHMNAKCYLLRRHKNDDKSVIAAVGKNLFNIAQYL